MKAIAIFKKVVMFPLIKLAKKLKVEIALTAPLGVALFPLIKLAKKLKESEVVFPSTVPKSFH